MKLCEKCSMLLLVIGLRMDFVANAYIVCIRDKQATCVGVRIMWICVCSPNRVLTYCLHLVYRWSRHFMLGGIRIQQLLWRFQFRSTDPPVVTKYTRHNRCWQIGDIYVLEFQHKVHNWAYIQEHLFFCDSKRSIGRNVHVTRWVDFNTINNYCTTGSM